MVWVEGHGDGFGGVNQKMPCFEPVRSGSNGLLEDCLSKAGGVVVGNEGGVVCELTAFCVSVCACEWEVGRIYEEKQGSKDGALWNACGDAEPWGNSCCYTNSLSTLGEVGGKPFVSGSVDSEVMEFGEESLVPHPIEGFGKIEEARCHCTSPILVSRYFVN